MARCPSEGEASDFLLHDVLMNVFSFLDAQSLASFSETARCPNFECFSFLELQLQRALSLGEGRKRMGEGHNHSNEGVGEEKKEDDERENLSRDDDSEREQDAADRWESNGESHHDEGMIDELTGRDVIPSFEGSIAGTGVISRLASLDSATARKVVQTYLDSNTSIHAMPLSHSLPYFRQVLMLSPFCQTPSRLSSQPPLPNIPEDTGSMLTEDTNVPTGCVGAYAHAVKTATTELTRLIKARRKSNFDALPPSERLERGLRFVDACTSNDELPIVERLLPCMDVDRIFIGPDGTETCALHAAAFNGAERVLRFLCGGVDERDPFYDGGLCDVNVRDANGWSALHFAAGVNSVKSVEVLAGHGAELTVEASNGYTPYHWAQRLSNQEVAVELEKLGADNRFAGRGVFGGGTGGDERKIPFVSFLANRFFGFSI